MFGIKGGKVDTRSQAKLGETMETTELSEWIAKEGAKVEERQVLVVLQTEKTSFELEAANSGILHISAPYP